MSQAQAKILREKAEMFEARAESATDPISRQHYKEMAAHYRSLAVEHLDVSATNRRTRPQGPRISAVRAAGSAERWLISRGRMPLASPTGAKTNMASCSRTSRI